MPIPVHQRGTRRWVAILANPRAGPNDRGSALADACEGLRALQFEPEIFFDRGAFAAATADPERLRAAHCIVAAGGDGTVAATLDLRRDCPLAILPLGSENLLAKTFKIPTAAGPWAAMVAARSLRYLDVADCSGRRFSLMASAGFDARVVASVHARRSGHVSRFDYLLAIVRALFAYRFPVIEGILDERETFSATQVFAFVQPAYALDLPICERDQPADGLLDVVWFPNLGRLQLLRYTVATLLRMPQWRPVSNRRRVRSVHWSAEDVVPIQTDGDPLGDLPVRIEISPSAATLIVPTAVQRSRDNRAAAPAA